MYRMSEGRTDEPTETLRWIDDQGRIASLEVPVHVAKAVTNGEVVSFRTDAEPTRRSKAEALEEIADERVVLLARKDQVEAERDALVDRYPQLKAAPRFIPPDEAA
jgi:hypothetical protein